MPLGFLFSLKNNIAKLAMPDGTIKKISARRLPKGVAVGADVEAYPDQVGNIQVEKPVKSKGKAKDRQQYAFKYLQKKGWKPHQAAGAVGRFMQEAFPDLRTTAKGDLEIPGGSVGVAQWNRERKAAMIAYTTGKIPQGQFANHPLVKAAHAASPGSRSSSDLDAQLDFWDWEIRNSPSERKALITLEKATNEDEASAAMMHFERPRGYTPGNPRGGHGFSNTVRNTQAVLGDYDPNYHPQIDTAEAIGGRGGNNGASDYNIGDLAGIDGLGGEDDLGMDDMEDDEPEEETLGSVIGDAALAYGEGSGEDLGADNRQAISEMIEQGRQASMQGPLPGFPTIRELFGEG